MNKEFTVYFEGKIAVEAESESEATQMAYEELDDSGRLQFNITATEEGECVGCGGTGEVSCDVMNSDGHIESGVGTKKCLCQV